MLQTCADASHSKDAGARLGFGRKVRPHVVEPTLILNESTPLQDSNLRQKCV